MKLIKKAAEVSHQKNNMYFITLHSLKCANEWRFSEKFLVTVYSSMVKVIFHMCSQVIFYLSLRHTKRLLD